MIWKTAFHSLESCVSWQGEQIQDGQELVNPNVS